MARPTLTPISTTSTVVLTATGSSATASDTTNYPFGLYVEATSDLYDTNFISGAIDQVAHTYKKLGGDVLDIEITVGSVYSAYEESVLEYSYLINTHQSKNVLANVLGNTTGTFDHDGQINDWGLPNRVPLSGGRPIPGGNCTHCEWSPSGKRGRRQTNEEKEGPFCKFPSLLLTKFRFMFDSEAA